MLYEISPDGRVLWHAMPLLLAALGILAIAYRYYSAFLAARVASLDDSRITPAHTLNDGNNYQPTNRWVLFGHHFAAISGAGPLIGPVLAIQYGYMPGLLWLIIGVCLAGAVQDMLVLAASVRHGGKSLAEIARAELGPWAQLVVSAAILFIVIIALAGLGFVVVRALGGEEVPLPEGTIVTRSPGLTIRRTPPHMRQDFVASAAQALPWLFGNLAFEPEEIVLPAGARLRSTTDTILDRDMRIRAVAGQSSLKIVAPSVNEPFVYYLNGKWVHIVPGSSWGTFTIACTIPIAFFVGFYLYRIRKNRVVEASLIGATLTLAATVAGNWIPGSHFEPWFSLSQSETVFALASYGFVASVLPVWMLLCPRDYLSSFLKIGTIALLVIGTLWANPPLVHPPVNEVFASDGPTFRGGLFPFVFICIMCGSISGFHSLVSSGTTPKMIDRESHIRGIGYGAMLMEGLVGIVALLAAASLDPKIYYEINVANEQAPQWQEPLDRLYEQLGNADSIEHLNLEQIEEKVGGERLRGRTGGAVTLAVGMSLILTKPLNQLGLPFDSLMKYWYHFAIMFEALFILTTIDTGTRIARFLVQEMMGKIRPAWGRPNWVPGALFATLLVTTGWGLLVLTGSIDTIWPMFGIANQLLAVLALALVTTWLVNNGRSRFAWVTILPMLFVTATTMSAGAILVNRRFPALIQQGQVTKGVLNLMLTIFVMMSVATLLLLAVARWIMVARWRRLSHPSAGETSRDRAV